MQRCMETGEGRKQSLLYHSKKKEKRKQRKKNKKPKDKGTQATDINWDYYND